MIYDLDKPEYIEPADLVSAIQEQYEKPFEQASECEKLLVRVESDARQAYQALLQSVAKDQNCSLEDVQSRGSTLFQEKKRKDLLSDIERLRQPVWYFAEYSEGHSGYTRQVPDSYIEGTLKGPAPWSEFAINEEKSKIDRLVEQVIITERDISNAWDDFYYWKGLICTPRGFKRLVKDVKDTFDYRDRMKYAASRILDIMKYLSPVSEETSDNASQIPRYCTAPIPWAYSDNSLRSLFKHLADKEYVFNTCVDQFEELVEPHFSICGSVKPYMKIPGRIQWRFTKTSLIALFTAMSQAGFMSPDELSSFASIITHNFIDKNGHTFKPGALRALRSNNEEGKSFKSQEQVFLSLLLSIRDL